ncbi:hypothetical protein [Streptomyces sp. Caat 7-52]|uniref:hypothetical protein n=1 Tax=Streptomyces sp. Caat 7-52 TaxID=2949637 RepID=UPI00203545FC|nr:hypothetical protein [Streptomyces sp. Caat 7-52]
MTVGGWCRTLRAGVFAAVCVLLAALGHVMMSGAPVPWWAMAAAGAGTGTAGWCLAGRERGRALIVTVVVAVQAVLHEIFAMTQSHACGPNAVSPGTASDVDPMHMGLLHMGSMHMGSVHMGSMDMGSVHMDAMNTAGTGHVGHGMHGLGGGGAFGMFAAHLLAAVLCGLWLAYGERAVFRILRAVAARLVAPLRMLLDLPVPPSRTPVRRRRDFGRRTLARLLLCHAITSRGPPVGAAVA